MQNQPTQAALYHRKSWKTKVISSLHLKVEQLKKLNSELHEQPEKAANRQTGRCFGRAQAAEKEITSTCLPLPNAGRGRHLASQHPLPGWHWEPEDDVAHPPAPEAESGGGTGGPTRLLRPRPRPSSQPLVFSDFPAAFPTNRAEAPDIRLWAGAWAAEPQSDCCRAFDGL